MTQHTNSLLPFRVVLHEEPGNSYKTVFDCMAEDTAHAEEQAQNAYPDSHIVQCLEFGEEKFFYLHSPSEAAASGDRAGYWSNTQGWGLLEAATQFTHFESLNSSLPMSVANDAQFVPCNDLGPSADQADDLGLTEKELQAKHASQHPEHTREDWQLGVAQGDTQLGYWEWVLHNVESHHNDASPACNTGANELPVRSGESLSAQGSSDSSTLQVSLDGGQTFIQAPSGVRIIYSGVMIDGEEGRGELHIHATPEGLITDLWRTRDDPLDHNIGTGSDLVTDMITRLVASSQ